MRVRAVRSVCSILFLAVWISINAPARGGLVTSFEGGDDGPFSVGPTTAVLTGGEAKTVGVPGLYKTGVASYMVEGAAAIGRIDFDGPGAETVDFFAANGGNGQATVDVFGLDDSTLLTSASVVAATMTDPAAEFNFFGLGPIGRVDVTNAPFAGQPPYQTAIDDFGFTAAEAAAIPEPATWCLVLIAGGLGAGARRVSRRRGRHASHK